LQCIVVKVNLIGFKELEAKLKNLPAKIKKEVGAEIQFSGERFAELAKKDVVKDSAQLAASIRPVPVSDLSVEVVVQKDYAPYVEWGTIEHVEVPAELTDYAIQFKGLGIRKSGGVYPRPFFFKQIPQVRKETLEHIENILSDIV
jgi:hypothetical protein